MGVNNFICPRCGNKNPKYIGYKNDEPYCRFCIAMKGESAKPYTPKGGLVVLDLHVRPQSKRVASVWGRKQAATNSSMYPGWVESSM